MNSQNEKMQLLGSAPVPKALLAMGVPTMIGMLVNAFYNLADVYFVSGLGERQTAALSVSYPFGQIVVGIGLLFGSGAASVISRLLGRGDTARAEQTASTALYGSLIVGAAVVIAFMAFLQPVLKLLGATESVMPFAVSYARIYVASCIFTVFNVTMNSIAASEGAAKTTMCALLIGAALNIALDPLFIYAFGWGVSGAAFATALSQAVSTCVYLAYILRKKSLFRFRFSDCAFTAETLSGISKIGAPTLVFQILTCVSISLTNNAAGRYGDAAIAGMGIVTRLISLGSLSVFGFVKGFQPVAGYSYGAKNFVRLRESIKVAVLWTTAFCAAFGLTLAIFPAAIVSQFAAGNAEVIRIGAAALRANGISMTLFGFYTVYSALFLAMGNGGAGFVLGSCRQGICFVPVILFLPAVCGLNGILYAQPVADALSAAVTVCMAISLHRKMKVSLEF